MDFDSIRDMVEEFFNGQYEVRKFLGEGSFSDVVLVNHKFLNDLRAMKIIKEPLKATTNTKSIFNEVRLATKLRNQNIINIYDAGIISKDNDWAYFVMEYVPGGDLEQYLNSFVNSNISMPILRVLKIMKQILAGLICLHSSNPPIIHRDLKLNNILLNYTACGDIEIKISDFGFAKEVTESLSDIDIVGTRPYMAPECFNKTVSVMTDIYAVGVIFYQLLTAHYPYAVDEFEINELRDLKPWKSRLIQPSHYNKNISDNLDAIVCKCLEFDPKDRYQNADELLSDIDFAIEDIESNQNFKQFGDIEYVDDFTDYIINDSLKEAFRLAKCENGLDEAIEILEIEVLKDYNVRKYYGGTLRIWKSKRPDVKLISKAFTVNLKAKNYNVSCNLLMEAIAYNPTIKNNYAHYLDLWHIFIDLTQDNNLIKAVLDLEDLMGENDMIHDEYCRIINVLKTYSIEDIVQESLRLVKNNNLVDGANLMEFAVICDYRMREKYEYKLSLWKQNLEVHYVNRDLAKHHTIDYAIDLGTVDSIVSYYNDGNPIIVKNHQTGDDITPSAVLINDDEVIVGNAARNAIIKQDTNAITEFKHNMGFAIPFKVENSPKSLYPEDLSAHVLKDLRLSVYKQCGFDMEHAVISIPANSNPLKTKAIHDACELAGFRSYNLIYEPIAVAIAYDLKASPGKNGIWMVYDLGGATFNVSLIKDNGKIFEIISTNGFDKVGGDLFDWKIVEEVFVPKIIGDLHLTDFRKDNFKYANAFSKLKKASENAKIDLSDNDFALVEIQGLFENYDFRYRLQKDEFTRIIHPILSNTFELCHSLMNKNSLGLNDIDKIILVGGSCLSPIIQGLIKDEFKLPIEYDIDPLTVVSRGAAIYAGGLEKPHGGPQVNEVSLALGKNDGALYGRVFTFDNKQSFLGFDIEFNDVRIPLGIDGLFKMDLIEKECQIRVYRDDELIEIDERSPNRIEDGRMFIPLFEKFFNFTKHDQIADYGTLIDSISHLDDFGFFDNWDDLRYLERLVEMSESNEAFLNQVNIYIDYLRRVVSADEMNLEFSILLENVENKMDILDENIDLDGIIKDKDFIKLKEVHEDLIRKYILLNKNQVIEDCFNNLRYDGVYIDNLELSDLLIEKGLEYLDKRDYDELSKVIGKLYELDGRRHDAGP